VGFCLKLLVIFSLNLKWYAEFVDAAVSKTAFSFGKYGVQVSLPVNVKRRKNVARVLAKERISDGSIRLNHFLTCIVRIRIISLGVILCGNYSIISNLFVFCF
jgi:hypothetical protein